MSEEMTVAIIGGGPVGLAAAAHAVERSLKPIVLEAGSTAGAAVRAWGHVQMFSPWRYNVDAAAARLLTATGWNAPDSEDFPTGAELYERYIQPLAERTSIAEHVLTSSRVTSVTRAGFDKVKSKGRERAPFGLRVVNGNGTKVIKAQAVVDTSGTWLTPGPAGANGTRAVGEEENAAAVSYGMPNILGADRSRFAGRTVAVVGAGHSAVGNLIELAALREQEPSTKIIWLLRGDTPDKSYGGGANDQLAQRGVLGMRMASLVELGLIQVETSFPVTHLSRQDGRLRVSAGSPCCGRHVVVDQLIVATGFRPDLSFLAELRVALDPALDCPPDLAPLIDPNLHSCGTVRPHGARELAHPEPGFYIAGMKSYGRAPTFLMATGYEQVRSIVADITGDKKAAARVELVLPETGVCSGPSLASAAALATSCCATSKAPAAKSIASPSASKCC